MRKTFLYVLDKQTEMVLLLVTVMMDVEMWQVLPIPMEVWYNMALIGITE